MRVKKLIRTVWKRDYIPYLVLAIVFLILGTISPSLFTSYSLSSWISTATPVALMTAGEMVVLIVGGIDLSLAATVGFTSCLTAGLLYYSHWPVVITIITVILVGALIGFMNGIIVVKGKLISFIVTIATGVAIKGATLIYTKGTSIPGTSDAFISAFTGTFLGVPNYFILAVVVLALLSVVLKTTKFGRYLYAIGGNEIAARTVGIDADSLRIVAFMIAGALYALGGIVLAAQFDCGWPQAASGWEMDGIAASVIGGGSFFGGEGVPFGAIPGALALDLITKFLVAKGVDPYWQYVFKGLLVVLVASALTRGEYGR